MKLFHLLLASVLVASMTGCSNILTATRDNPIQENHGTRTIGSRIDDPLIETKARVNVAKAHPALKENSRIIVQSFNGIVLLAGQVPNSELSALAEKTVREVQRVKHVHNELTIGAPISLLARNNDSLISTNAKTRLLADNNIPGRRISVTTEAGVVYLMGLVRRAEAERAVQTVQQVGGVQRIVKLFEYID